MRDEYIDACRWMPSSILPPPHIAYWLARLGRAMPTLYWFFWVMGTMMMTRMTMMSVVKSAIIFQ